MFSGQCSRQSSGQTVHLDESGSSIMARAISFLVARLISKSGFTSSPSQVYFGGIVSPKCRSWFELFHLSIYYSTYLGYNPFCMALALIVIAQPLEDLLGQDLISQIYAKKRDRINLHTHIFCGSRGTVRITGVSSQKSQIVRSDLAMKVYGKRRAVQ